MIEIVVERNSNHTIHSFSMSGHAESGPYGQDIVCAGASAVSLGAVNGISALCNIELDVDMSDNGGYLRCTVPSHVSGRVFEDVQLLLEGMLVSLHSIAEEYGDYMTIAENQGGE
ncbi:ribosomal-processing cysteine protease Prp [Thalassorhabdus alkalitolerans]|uniref:Ribosomal processing cysteine protease Prp n=1 Tax=Thalassorhabdus alkalitolerans TaxID=2282697 RepID=A0ABW0YJQ9_9BACI